MLDVRVCDVVVTPCDLAQVGDTTTTNRNTAVAVSGLSSGVVMVAAGYVRARVVCSLLRVLGTILGACVCAAVLSYFVACSGGIWMYF